MKKLLIMILILIPLIGCIETQPEQNKFHGTWIPCSNFGLIPGYSFDPSGNVYKVIKIGDEIYYMNYCAWHLEQHVLILCGQRLNFKFEGNKLYLYDLHGASTQTCYMKVTI